MAIIYSYPEKITPADGDFLVITDSEQTAPNKNRTKSLKIENLADYIVSSTSGITGSGTLNTIAMFTPDGQSIGDSRITQAPLGQAITVNTNLFVSDDFNVTGSAEVNSSLTVEGISTFNDDATFESAVTINDALYDQSSSSGTVGQVLTSTGFDNVEWTDIADISGSVTGSGTLNNIPIWTPDGQTLGDSSISFDPITESVIIQGTSGTTQDLLVTGIDARIAIRSNTAGDANIEFIPNVTSNHAAVFELTDTDFNRHFLWQENGNEIMRLNGYNGNLGLGVTNPGYKVHVDGSSGFRADDSGTPYFLVLKASGNTFLDTGVNGGTINIGAPTSWTQNLYVQGNVRFRDGIKDINDSVGTSGQILSSTGSAVEWDDATDVVSGAIAKLIPFQITASAGGSSTYSADNNIVEIGWTGGNGTYVLNIPSATTIPYRNIRFVTNSTFPNGASDKVEITAQPGETIDGNAFFEISKVYEGVSIWSNGNEWIVIQAKAH